MGYTVPVSGNRMVYGGYLMRSNLEVNLAIALDAHRVTWQYEAEQITLPDGRRYFPDFTITNDPCNVVDAELIEVKDRKHVWRCAQTLGLGSNGGEEKNYIWTPPIHARGHDLSGPYWSTLEKPVQTALMGRRVLIVGATTMNAAVILMGGGGLMSAKRRHRLMSRIYDHVSISGSFQAPRDEILRTAEFIRDSDVRRSKGWLGMPEVTRAWVHNATVTIPLNHVRELLQSAQQNSEEARAVA